MGWIVAQSEPFGQHNTVVLAARGMQTWFAGQQKDDGRPGSVHCVKLESVQVEARSKMLYEDWATVKVGRQTAAKSRGLEIRLILPPDRNIVVWFQVRPVSILIS